MEDDQFIQTVDKLRPENFLDFLHDGILHHFIVAKVGHRLAAEAQRTALTDLVCAGIAGHDNDRILKGDRPAGIVRQTPVFENLQEFVQYIFRLIYRNLKD